MKMRMLALTFCLLAASGAWALPQLSIATAGGVEFADKHTVEGASLILKSDDGTSIESEIQIRIRGNSTSTMAKSSYRLKLNKAQSLLGMPADKDWVLVANYSDKTLLRNYTAYELSRRLGMAYTPRVQYVELTFNGIPLGNYLLAEQVKVSPNRVAAGKDGFLLELDQRRDSDIRFTTMKDTPYNIKSPSKPTQEQQLYIQEYIQEIEDVLQSLNFADPMTGYAKYIDADSFVNFFIVEELFKNQDAAKFSSIYLYKEAGQKLKMGPVWDFDISAGNVDYSDAKNPVGWWLRTDSPWFRPLMDDPKFRAMVKTRWNEVKKSQIKTIFAFIDETAASLKDSQKKNFEIWPILDKQVWPNPVVTGSYKGEVKYLKMWLDLRMKWLDSQINAF